MNSIWRKLKSSASLFFVFDVDFKKNTVVLRTDDLFSNTDWGYKTQFSLQFSRLVTIKCRLGGGGGSKTQTRVEV